MSKPLRVHRLTDHEGRQVQQIVRRGGGRSEKSIVRWRRVLAVQASAGGNTVPVIARLVQTSEDRVREMIHRFNEKGMASLDTALRAPRTPAARTSQSSTIRSGCLAAVERPSFSCGPVRSSSRFRQRFPLRVDDSRRARGGRGPCRCRWFRHGRVTYAILAFSRDRCPRMGHVS